MASETAEFESEGKAASGYIVVERYSYFGAGPDEGSVTDFMATSPALNEWCVKNNVEFV